MTMKTKKVRRKGVSAARRRKSSKRRKKTKKMSPKWDR
jgi:hypothetical protein